MAFFVSVGVGFMRNKARKAPTGFIYLYIGYCTAE